MFCVLENLRFLEFYLPIQQSTALNVRVRTKRQLPKERIDNDPESARESASTRASAKRDASQGVEATLTDGTLESSLAGTGLEAPEQSRLPSRRCNELLSTAGRTPTVARSWGK